MLLSFQYSYFFAQKDRFSIQTIFFYSLIYLTLYCLFLSSLTIQINTFEKQYDHSSYLYFMVIIFVLQYIYWHYYIANGQCNQQQYHILNNDRNQCDNIERKYP
ncbi:hypothetical protein IMG5_164500 [Ichthyophthirius multifiliis]|uniref:Transmembrane protein n=1 Tax=Ichthyophthirius multifiliis TaxID=5932 RepID=G0R0F9_ICHMU|nr:hypothetical protein IMG5_164500 [Ichthyophthirius multifiliis]EGR29038.1 hypothetical protein IMG5_164500 [Ichthyophthirius multifiliis]|eukprot:XP_004030274.1 hypothetical protein IMG5_164500 [Ichthyophthirius multifiliis]